MSDYTKGEAREITDSDMVRIQVGQMGYPLADCHDSIKGEDECIANAKRIALTWNCHDELVAALEISRGQWIHSINAKQCLDALAKAKGESK